MRKRRFSIRSKGHSHALACSLGRWVATAKTNEHGVLGGLVVYWVDHKNKKFLGCSIETGYVLVFPPWAEVRFGLVWSGLIYGGFV